MPPSSATRLQQRKLPTCKNHPSNTLLSLKYRRARGRLCWIAATSSTTRLTRKNAKRAMSLLPAASAVTEAQSVTPASKMQGSQTIERVSVTKGMTGIPPKRSASRKTALQRLVRALTGTPLQRLVSLAAATASNV